MNARAMLRITLGALTICDLRVAGQNSSAPSAPLMLHIHLYDRANVPRQTLDRATEETTHVLAAAGIQVSWQHGEPDSPEGRTVNMTSRTFATDLLRDDRPFVVVRMVRGVPAIALPRALGFALPWAQNGVHVTMFYDRIEELALSVPACAAKILGNGLAHEIGHVLLRSERHSLNGVMKAVWSRADYQQLAAGQLEFQPHQAVVLREEVSRRARCWTLRSAIDRP